VKVTLQLLASTIGGIVFMVVLLFVPAGTFHYWQAWVFIVVFIIGTMVPTVYLAARSPDALARRMTSGPWNETRLAQKLIMVALPLSVIVLGVISALDYRFRWSTVPTSVVIVGNLLVFVGLLMAEAVVIQNNYAAATITVERDQPVVSTGLYGIVRHPMYVGALIMIVGMPLALASYWGLLAVIPVALIFAARIVDEENALRADLDGYDEYTEKVPYRLLPGVW
jgi:protein-S-isoprenylcysteine O-methyltransferase Ste14